jgi:hypothetical protein
MIDAGTIGEVKRLYVQPVAQGGWGRKLVER